MVLLFLSPLLVSPGWRTDLERSPDRRAGSLWLRGGDAAARIGRRKPGFCAFYRVLHIGASLRLQRDFLQNPVVYAEFLAAGDFARRRRRDGNAAVDTFSLVAGRHPRGAVRGSESSCVAGVAAQHFIFGRS